MLSTEENEHRYWSRENEMRRLAERAWADRLRITVVAEVDQPHRPLEIIVREPPTTI